MHLIKALIAEFIGTFGDGGVDQSGAVVAALLYRFIFARSLGDENETTAKDAPAF